MLSACAFVPEEQLGISILTNQAEHLGATCLLNLLLDRFLDQPSQLWHQRAKATLLDMGQTIQAARKKMEAERGQEKPSLPLNEYVGHFEHPAYGPVWIRSEGEQLTIELWTGEKGLLKPWNADQFEITNFPTGKLVKKNW